MDLLIEHNAFQCIDKCLNGKARNNDDIDDFLQICIQQIFCDQLQLSNFVPDYVKESCKMTQNPLQYLPHLPDNILSVVTTITNAIKDNNIDLLTGEL